MPKMVHFGEFVKTLSLQSNSVARQVTFKSGKCQNSKIQMRHFEQFLNNVNAPSPKTTCEASGGTFSSNELTSKGSQ